MSYGVHRSEEELLLEAIRLLREGDEAVAVIQEGLGDADAGRTRGLREVDDDMRKKYSIPPQQ